MRISDKITIKEVKTVIDGHQCTLQTTGPICYIGDLTLTNSDMDNGIHLGITIGKGKRLYWMMTWHGKSGHVTLYSKSKQSPRWIDGGTEVTVHFIKDPRKKLK